MQINYHKYFDMQDYKIDKGLLSRNIQVWEQFKLAQLQKKFNSCEKDKLKLFQTYDDC